MNDLTRRDLLQLAAASAMGATTRIASASETTSPRELPLVPPKNGLFTRGPIEVYTSTLSATPGETVTLHVSTTAKRFDLQIARVGATEKIVWAKNDLPAALYPTPEDAWEKGCNWPAAVSVKIPHDWRSGYYQISAVTADSGTARTALAFVVVRAAQPTAKILMVLATATYGAYNNYGSASLYVKRGNKERGGFIGGERRVSFLRPWMPGFLWKPDGYSFDAEFADIDDLVKTAGVRALLERDDDRSINPRSGLTVWSNVAGFHNWDRVMIRWLEMNGYTVDYAISSDLELHPELLGRYRLMLSVGHDEYWSWGMRDTVENFIKRSGNVCFFSADLAWQIRHEDNGNTMICYKEGVEEDPLFGTDQKHLTATLWGSPIVGRPEISILGVSYAYGGWGGWRVSPQTAGGHLIYRTDHWVLKDSGLQYGDLLGQASKIVHFEVDGCPIRMEEGLPYPAKNYDGPSSFEILGMRPVCFGLPDVGEAGSDEVAKKLLGDGEQARALKRNRGHAVMGIYNNNGTVFTAGTTDWTNGLTGKDPVVERVTKNLLDRLSV